MFFSAVLQPRHDPKRQKEFISCLTNEEKAVFANSLASLDLPIVIDHAGVTGKNPVIPEEKIIGRVKYGYLNSHGDLCILGHVPAERIESQQLLASLMDKKKVWGVSAYTEWDDPEWTGDVYNRRISHVGITENPVWGPQGSYFQTFSTKDYAVRNKLREQFRENKPLYLPEPLRKHLADTANEDTANRTRDLGIAPIGFLADDKARSSSSLVAQSGGGLAAAASSSTSSLFSLLSASPLSIAKSMSSPLQPEGRQDAPVDSPNAAAAMQQQQQQQQQQPQPIGPAKSRDFKVRLDEWMTQAKRALEEPYAFRKPDLVREAIKDFKTLHVGVDNFDMDQALTPELRNLHTSLSQALKDISFSTHEYMGKIKEKMHPHDFDRFTASLEKNAPEFTGFCYASADLEDQNQKTVNIYLSKLQEKTAEIEKIKKEKDDIEKARDDLKRKADEAFAANDDLKKKLTEVTQSIQQIPSKLTDFLLPPARPKAPASPATPAAPSGGAASASGDGDSSRALSEALSQPPKQSFPEKHLSRVMDLLRLGSSASAPILADEMKLHY